MILGSRHPSLTVGEHSVTTLGQSARLQDTLLMSFRARLRGALQVLLHLDEVIILFFEPFVDRLEILSCYLTLADNHFQFQLLSRNTSLDSFHARHELVRSVMRALKLLDLIQLPLNNN